MRVQPPIPLLKMAALSLNLSMRPETQVLVVPIGSRDSPVPFGRVVRGGGAAIEFFVDETRSLEELREDWTATHELSHLLMPFVASKDRWLSEGLASYYQNVLRARDGRISEKQAWENLNSGFERGRKSTTNNQSLATATKSGWSSTMRVYWSGAAILLMADARLRAVSDRQQSLDTALNSLYNCCWESRSSWRAKDVFSELDRLTGHRVFTDLYEQHVFGRSFPDLSQTYEKLGVDADSETIKLIPQAVWGDIRTDIMRDSG
jgi:hypothetical protein